MNFADPWQVGNFISYIVGVFVGFFILLLSLILLFRLVKSFRDAVGGAVPRQERQSDEDTQDTHKRT